MKKLITGIAVVIILDLAFIWMVGNRVDFPEMAQEVTPNFEGSVVLERPSLEPVSINDGDELVERAPDPPAPADRTEDVSGPTPAASKIRKSNIEKTDTPSLDAKRLFPDVIIYVEKYEAPETSDPYLRVSPVKNSARPDAAAAEPLAATRKRSFKSRAFGVIKMPFNVVKKPFKWIGSVASDIVR